MLDQLSFKHSWTNSCYSCYPSILQPLGPSIAFDSRHTLIVIYQWLIILSNIDTIWLGLWHPLSRSKRKMWIHVSFFSVSFNLELNAMSNFRLFVAWLLNLMNIMMAPTSPFGYQLPLCKIVLRVTVILFLEVF